MEELTREEIEKIEKILLENGFKKYPYDEYYNSNYENTPIREWITSGYIKSTKNGLIWDVKKLKQLLTKG